METLSQAASAAAAVRDDPACQAVCLAPWAPWEPVEHIEATCASDVWQQDDAQGQGYAKRRKFFFGSKHGRNSKWLVDDMTPFMVRAPGYWAVRVAYECGLDSLERVFVYPTAEDAADFRARRKALNLLPIINPLPDPPGPGEDAEIKTIEKQVLVQLWGKKSVTAAKEAVQEVDAPCLEEVAVARVLAEMREQEMSEQLVSRRTRRAAAAAEPAVPHNALGTSAVSYGATVYADLAAATSGSSILETVLGSLAKFIPELEILEQHPGNQNRNFMCLTFNEESAETLVVAVVDFIQYNMRHSTAFNALLKSSFGTNDPELYPHFHLVTQVAPPKPAL